MVETAGVIESNREKEVSDENRELVTMRRSSVLLQVSDDGPVVHILLI